MKKMCLFVLGLLFIVPTIVSGAVAPYAEDLGLIIKVEDCALSNVVDNYYFDISARSVELSERFNGDTAEQYPSFIDLTTYGDFTSEWVSVSKFDIYNGQGYQTDCKTQYYEYMDSKDQIPFTEFKVVVYQNQSIVAESDVYDVLSVVTDTNDLDGHMVVYNIENGTFLLEPYATEYVEFNNPYADTIGWIIIAVFIVLGILAFSVLVLIEPIIMLLSKKGMSITLLSLILNGLSLGIMLVPFVIDSLQGPVAFLFFIVAEAVLVFKVLRIRKENPKAKVVSLIFSIINSLVFIVFTFALQ